MDVRALQASVANLTTTLGEAQTVAETTRRELSVVKDTLAKVLLAVSANNNTETLYNFAGMRTAAEALEHRVTKVETTQRIKSNLVLNADFVDTSASWTEPVDNMVARTPWLHGESIYAVRSDVRPGDKQQCYNLGQTNKFPVDHLKSYRFSIWIKGPLSDRDRTTHFGFYIYDKDGNQITGALVRTDVSHNCGLNPSPIRELASFFPSLILLLFCSSLEQPKFQVRRRCYTLDVPQWDTSCFWLATIHFDCQRLPAPQIQLMARLNPYLSMPPFFLSVAEQTQNLPTV